jgi:hypothetical protein
MPTTTIDPQAPPRSVELVAAATFAPLEAAATEGAPAPLPRFEMVAYTGAPMRLKGWRHPTIVDLDGVTIPTQNRPIRFEHDARAGVGHTDTLTIREGHLHATGVISRDTPEAREVVTAARNGFHWQASIGADVSDFELVRAGHTVAVNGRDWKGPIYVVRRATIGEISFVDIGADGATTASIAARADTEHEPDQADLPAPADEPKTSGAVLAQRRALEHRAELRARLTRDALAIRGARADDIQALAEEADAHDWTPDQYELRLRRTERPSPPPMQGRTARPTARVLECAFCETAGLTPAQLERHFDPLTIEAAGTPEFKGTGITELVYATIGAAGRYARPGRINNDIIRLALDANNAIQASGIGFSTISLTGILTPALNKIMLASYTAEPMTALLITSSSNAQDFRPSSLYRLTGSGPFLKVPQDGELKHLQLVEESYSQQVETYGRIVALTRQMLVNDDLDALTQIPRIMGRSSALTIQNAVYELLLSNPGTPALFSVAHNNLLTGTTSALSIESLGLAETLFLKQVDAAGQPIMLTPRYLLVPPELKAKAEQLMKSLDLNETTTAGKPAPAGNPFAGRYEVIVSPWLSNSAITGSSATAWYLLADPILGGVLNIAYLRGNRSPLIETGATDFDTLGIRWRGYFDFGVGVLDYRAGVKAAGV